MDPSHPDPSLIGKAFVKQYYTQLHHDPSQMHRFYLEQSTMVHGGSELGSAERVVGQKAIHEKILSMDLQRVYAKIKQVDSDLTLGQGIAIQVTGELSTAGQPMRAFVQTFVLAPESPKKYYVRNDFFRYQDDDLVSESETNEMPGEGESLPVVEQPQEDMDYLQQTPAGAMPAEVVKEDSGLYSSPGAELVAVGDQVLQEEVGGASSWDQFSTEPTRMGEIQQNGLASEEEAVSEVPPAQTTPLAPPTSAVAATPPDMPAPHLPGETEGTGTETEAFPMETHEPPEAVKGTWADRLSRGFGTSAAPKPMPPAIPVTQPVPPRPAAPPTTVALPQRGDQQRKRMDRTPVKDPPPTRKVGGGGGSSRDMPDSCQIFVGGLPGGSTEADLRDVFSEYGTIVEVRVNQKNFAFVVFDNPESVQRLMAERERIQLRSKSLNIEPKRPSAPRSGLGRGKPGLPAGGGSGGGGGGRFRNSKPPKR